MSRGILLLCAWVACASFARGADEPVPMGAQVGKLRFVDTHYLPRHLGELQGRRATVLFFTTVECPLVQRYLPRIVRLAEELRPQGVQFLAVNEGPGDSILDVATQAVTSGAGFPFLKDFSGNAARGVGLDRTAGVVVLDAQRRLRYRGRVDDQYRFGGMRPEPSRADLRLAIAAVLAGREPEVSETAIDGCKITPPDLTPPAQPPTYAEQVAPLLQRHCVRCHRPGREAPFALLSYEDARDQAEMIGEVVRQGRMPPWFASDAHGEFVNDPRLAPAERETILAWVRGGAPAGDLSRAPPPPTFPNEAWQIGEPDLVLRAPETFQVPADGYVPYQYVMLPKVFIDDTWVERIQIRPSNPRVVHHANLAYLSLEEGLERSHFITGLVPGSGAMRLEPGQAQKIPQGALLILQIHYVTTGRPEENRMEVGLRFPRRPIEKEVRHLIVRDRRFEIPPGAPAHEVRATRTLKREAEGLALFAHMHLRGRDMLFRAHYPDGRSEPLLLIPNYNFDWQLAYRWAPGTRRFPAGTRLECVGHFDNSALNPYNPDPTVPVRYGDQTYHEMFFGFFFYTDPQEDLQLRVDPATGMAYLGEAGDADPAPR